MLKGAHALIECLGGLALALAGSAHIAAWAIWHGWTLPEQADTCEALLKAEVLPGIFAKQVAGFQRNELYRRPLGAEVEFITVMWSEHCTRREPQRKRPGIRSTRAHSGQPTQRSIPAMVSVATTAIAITIIRLRDGGRRTNMAMRIRRRV